MSLRKVAKLTRHGGAAARQVIHQCLSTHKDNAKRVSNMVRFMWKISSVRLGTYRNISPEVHEKIVLASKVVLERLDAFRHGLDGVLLVLVNVL